MHQPTAGVIQLDIWHLAIAALLVLVCGLVSLVLGLGLEKQLAVASVRTVAQLFLVGYVLKWVFRINSLSVLLLLLAVMIAAASHTAVQRSSRTYRGILWHSFVALTVSGLLTTFTVTGAVINVQPWYRPQYVIPLLGMILGNGLTGISLCLDYLLEALAERRAEVEMELAQGASRWEAGRGPISAAVGRGMIPNINAMLVVGIVSLPGMMTGQILSGTDPLTAVKYQIVVMFMIAAATALGCILIALLAYHRVFNAKHQLEARLIASRTKA
jgi:putative ABC transport system permease protein